MSSPKLRKPPLQKFWELFSKLPPNDQAQFIAAMYNVLPDYRGEFLCIDMRARLAEIAAQSSPVSKGEG